MDANFKLKQKERGFNDPPLSNGLVYMVANEKLQEHLADCSNTGQITEVGPLNCDGPWRVLIYLTLHSDKYVWIFVQRR